MRKIRSKCIFEIAIANNLKLKKIKIISLLSGLALVVIVGLGLAAGFFIEHINLDDSNMYVDFSEAEVSAVAEEKVNFDLKYTGYLIPEPYEYVSSGEKRYFRFNDMMAYIMQVENDLNNYRITYIDNYKDFNGAAPLYQGAEVDSKGTGRYAAVAGYTNINDLNQFDYIQDGTLVKILEEDWEYTSVSPVGKLDEYFVKSHYVQADECITSFEKAIVIDRKFQNMATFEKSTIQVTQTAQENYENHEGTHVNFEESEWYVTSYSLATTGKTGEFHKPTDLGFFYAIERKEQFYYLEDGTDIIAGYAPYAIRFNGGAYIHGVSTPYIYEEDGSRTDEGITEFSPTIGTVPLSHKCVRTYTSHAKFIYDWYEHGSTVVIVIE